MDTVKLNERVEVLNKVLTEYVEKELLEFERSDVNMSRFTEIAIKKAFTAGMMYQLEVDRGIL